ncbi:VapA/VapB family virulence-associated protein [Xenorhabdus sp. Reich]|uniref:VapA/VapB family virulence-associated protein n=1 Tax=Xenorhabdus littoralis TaxID=2582835 RepID=A0ABU4SK80_9GAMM|nr:VapA/VapB family virulence-associated protein [Xenorhabdus sp. Reich]MDX7999056.1 VapA/VapB family virulence-associated protein [Xenorhabdus sp. Reich]
MTEKSSVEKDSVLLAEEKFKLRNLLTESMRGKIDEETINNTEKNLSQNYEYVYAASATVVSFGFYSSYKIYIDGSKHFEGDAYGFHAPGYGKYVGRLHTNNIEKVFNECTHFLSAATTVTLMVGFSTSTFITDIYGRFDGIGFGSVGGASTGTGNWY